MPVVLERTAFVTSRLLEFFTEKELTMQIGHGRALWPIALVKELIDNALDACETAGVAPEITIMVEPDAVAVQDNGPGLPVSTLTRSLDYAVRVSDKAYYISPTRGQLGNALKCLWAAPFVVDGQHGQIDVTTGGTVHTIDVTLDRIVGQPELQHTTSPDGLVKNGTLVRMRWPEIASALDSPRQPGSYKTTDVLALIRAYATINPHAAFTLVEPDQRHEWQPTISEWAKWKPDTPTSAHWYTPAKLRDLIAAYLADERAGERRRTIREFVAEFGGLSGSAKQKTILERTGLARAPLSDLAMNGDIDIDQVAALLAVMQSASRPIKPAALGTIGEEHLTERLVSDYGVQRESVRYRRIRDEEDGLPFVLEFAFGALVEEYEGRGRQIVVGINWAPTITLPFNALPFLVGESRGDPNDPIVLLVHLAKPGVQFADRGKGQVS